MTLSDFAKIIEKTKIPTARAVFERKQSLPYTVFTETEFNVIYANGVPAYKEVGIELELYTVKNDMHSDKTLEKTFRDNSVKFAKISRSWLDNEKMMVTYYNIYI